MRAYQGVIVIEVVCSHCRKLIRRLLADDASCVTQSHGVCDKCLASIVEGVDREIVDELDLIPHAVFVVEGDGMVITANAGGRALSVLAEGEITGSLIGDVVGCENAAKAGGCGGQAPCLQCSARESIHHTMTTGRPVLRVKSCPGLNRALGGDRAEILLSTEKQNDLVLLKLEEVAIDEN